MDAAGHRDAAQRVSRTAGGWSVVLLDVRYSRSRDTGIGRATVTLDHELRPVR